VVVTINLQSAGIRAQLKAIDSEKETRDDEVFHRQAISCLEAALATITIPTDGKLYRNRTAWLDAARLILTSKKLSDQIKSDSVRKVYRASERIIRSKFMNRLDLKLNPETKHVAFFNPHDLVRNPLSKNKTLDKKSVYVIYKFASWPREDNDLMEEVDDDFRKDPISKGHSGASRYLNGQIFL
jgi:hypothetical protein